MRHERGSRRRQPNLRRWSNDAALRGKRREHGQVYTLQPRPSGARQARNFPPAARDRRSLPPGGGRCRGQRDRLRQARPPRSAGERHSGPAASRYGRDVVKRRDFLAGVSVLALSPSLGSAPALVRSTASVPSRFHGGIPGIYRSERVLRPDWAGGGYHYVIHANRSSVQTRRQNRGES